MATMFMVMVGMGLWGIVWTSWQKQEMWSSRYWVKTTGTVLSSTIDYQGGGQWPRPKKKGSFFPNIIYRYEVEDRIYTNNRLSFDKNQGSEESARAISKQFVEGSEIEVFCNPENPRQSVLEPGLRMSQFLPIGIGFLLTSIGCVGFVSLQYPGLIG